VFHAVVDDGHVDAQRGTAPRPPDMVVTADLEAFTLLGVGAVAATDPQVAGRIKITGSPDAAARALRIFVPQPVSARTSDG
jgi:hypothetical protein